MWNGKAKPKETGAVQEMLGLSTSQGVLWCPGQDLTLIQLGQWLPEALKVVKGL